MLTGSREHPAVCSRRMNLGFAAAIGEPGLRGMTGEFLAALTGGLKSGGCGLIGHIKGLIRAGRTDHLAFSVTSFDEAARIEGALHSDVSGAEFSITIIVYGIAQPDVERIFQKAFQEHFPGDNAPKL